MITLKKCQYVTESGHETTEYVALQNEEPIGLLIIDSEELASVFDRLYGGHGLIFHQSDAPPNPFFIKSWNKVFDGDELPEGTKNVFVDQTPCGIESLCRSIMSKADALSAR
jgi:hypothetical protein